MAEKMPAAVKAQPAPLPLEEVYRRRVELGTGRAPAELDAMGTQTSIVLEVSSGVEPRVELTRSEDDDEPDTARWRVTIPWGAQTHPSPVRRVLRPEGPKGGSHAAMTADDVAIAGNRPDWVDAQWQPRRAAVTERRAVHRLGGQRIEPAAVFGNDTRMEYQDATWPWGLVGRVIASNGSVSSGALVGPRHVLTSQHQLRRCGPTYRFVPAYFDGDSLHGRGVGSHVRYSVSSDRGADVASGSDVAVLLIEDALGDWLGWFGARAYSEDWNDRHYWSIIGYPWSDPDTGRPRWQDGISVFDVDGWGYLGTELESNDSDLTSGNSGSPMFGWWKDGPYIVGTYSGAEEDTVGFTRQRANVMAGGPEMVATIRYARSIWGSSGDLQGKSKAENCR